MDYQYVLGGVLVSLLGFVFFMIINTTLSGEKKKVVQKFSRGINRDGYVRMPSQNCGFQPEIASGTNVVIVGARVAGAALAYTLGKEGRRVNVIERDLNSSDLNDPMMEGRNSAHCSLA